MAHVPLKGQLGAINAPFHIDIKPMQCKHLNITDGFSCSLGFYGGYPSPEQCSHCVKFEQVNMPEPEKTDLKNNVSAGLGDTIAKITSAAGIKPCGKCKKRQSALNRMFPYKQGSDQPNQGLFSEPPGCKSCGKKRQEHGND